MTCLGKVVALFVASPCKGEALVLMQGCLENGGVLHSAGLVRILVVCQRLAVKELLFLDLFFGCCAFVCGLVVSLCKGGIAVSVLARYVVVSWLHHILAVKKSNFC